MTPRFSSLLLFFLFIFSGIPSELPAKDLGHTFFQTNVPFDPRIALDVDFVVVHRHGDPKVGEAMKTWMEAGYPTGRMFFIGSDAGRLYTTGKWDGNPHLDETEVDRNGKPIECGGERPYMIPTPGWKEFVHEQIRQGIDAGAVCILPEEPLAHVTGGYGEAFKRIWAERYGKPWEPPDSTPDNYYKSSKLLCDLYFELVEDALAFTKQYAAEKGRDVKFLLPIHPLLSHAVGMMTYASGRTLGLASKGLDGFVGQVWTGPIAWGMSKAEGKRMDRNDDFFESAYLMYSYFANLVKGTNLDCYMLADPVEDDPKYSWEDYRKWYSQCLVAMLQFPWMKHFEVMPWPDRVFLPGYNMASGTPGPEDYRRALMIAFAALKKIGEATGEEESCDASSAGADECRKATGYLVTDTLSWQRGGPEGSRMESVHGFTVPLLRRGIPIGLVPLERHADTKYMDGFKILVLSYDAQKPLDPAMNTDLAAWVKRGGNLIYLGGEDAYNSVDEWWRRDGCDAPQEHLWEALGIWKKGGEKSAFEVVKDLPTDGELPKNIDSYWHVYEVGMGKLLNCRLPAAWFADAKGGGELAMRLSQMVCPGSEETRHPEDLRLRHDSFTSCTDRFCAVCPVKDMSFESSLFLDLFDSQLSFRKSLSKHEAALLCDPMPASSIPNRLLYGGPYPKVLLETENLMRLELHSPDNTPATMRMEGFDGKLKSVEAKSMETGKPVEVRQEEDEYRTWLFIVPAGFKGATLEVRWEDSHTKR
jgi:hypothetical protein